MKRLRSRKQQFNYRKDRGKPKKDERLTKRILKTLCTRNTQGQTSHQAKARQINLENHTFLYLNWQKPKFILSSFIQIFKPFILFSVLCSQPKIRNFWCDKLPHLTGISSRDSERLGRKIKQILTPPHFLDSRFRR